MKRRDCLSVERPDQCNLQTGDRLPGIRAVAEEFAVHQRVALAAYREMERDGLVALRARPAVYVREAQPDNVVLPKLAARLVEFLIDALGMGVWPPDVSERIRRCLETVRLRAVCIECNADQIDSLCTGRAMFASFTGGSNLQTLVVGRDDLTQIPVGAPVYMMRRASELLHGHPFLSRVPPLERALGVDSARELLQFVVRANMAALAGLSTREV